MKRNFLWIKLFYVVIRVHYITQDPVLGVAIKNANHELSRAWHFLIHLQIGGGVYLQ